MFISRQSECSGIALSDITVLVHKFNNTICQSENVFLTTSILTGTFNPKSIVAS